MNRLEHEQRPLHGLTVDPITAVFFAFTFLINILTFKLFYNDLTNAIILIYQMYSGITHRKFRKSENNSLQSIEEVSFFSSFSIFNFLIFDSQRKEQNETVNREISYSLLTSVQKAINFVSDLKCKMID